MAKQLTKMLLLPFCLRLIKPKSLHIYVLLNWLGEFMFYPGFFVVDAAKLVDDYLRPGNMVLSLIKDYAVLFNFQNVNCKTHQIIELNVEA